MVVVWGLEFIFVCGVDVLFFVFYIMFKGVRGFVFVFEVIGVVVLKFVSDY